MLGFRACQVEQFLLFIEQMLEIIVFNIHKAKMSDVTCLFWTVSVTSGLASASRCHCLSPPLSLLGPVSIALLWADWSLDQKLQWILMFCGIMSMLISLAFTNLYNASKVSAVALLIVLLLYLLVTAAMYESFIYVLNTS